MSLSLVTFADLGKRSNRKTQEALSVIEKFFEEKELDQVICRINKGFYFPKTISAVPVLVHYFLRGTEEYLDRSFPARKLEEQFFDMSARGEIKQSDAVIFYPARFPKTQARAKEKGSIVISVGTEADPRYVAELEREERVLLGLKETMSETKRLANDSTGQADYIIALSDLVKDTYIKYGFDRERIFVASPDIERNRFKCDKIGGRDKFRVLFVSDISMLKGLHYLLQAWQSLKLKDAELLILGSYKRSDLDPELEKKYASIIGNDRSICYLGHQDPQDHYSRSSVLVTPSLTEGFCKVNLEAMACGLPVITTENAMAIVEDGKTGFVVPIRNAQALAEKIKYFYERPQEAAEMGISAREAFLRKPDFGEQVFEIYKNILLRENRK